MLNIIILLLVAVFCKVKVTSNLSVNYESIRCVLKSAKEYLNLNDEFISKQLKNEISTALLIEDYFDLRDYLLSHYVSHEFLNKFLESEEYIQSILELKVSNCQLPIENLLAFCREIHQVDECQMSSIWRAFPKFSNSEFVEREGIVFKKCPPRFIELIDRCQKPESYNLNFYKEEFDCKQDNNNECSAMSNNIWKNNCSESFREVLGVHCIPFCLTDMSEDDFNCYKEPIYSNETVPISLEIIFSQ